MIRKPLKLEQFVYVVSHRPGKQMTHLDTFCIPVNLVRVVVFIEVEILVEIIIALIQQRS